jgi:molybdate transport system substrate-binding protein
MVVCIIFWSGRDETRCPGQYYQADGRCQTEGAVALPAAPWYIRYVLSANNNKQQPAMTTPTDYPSIPQERQDDLHHLEITAEADLVLFMAGNQFMVMPELVRAFQQRYPSIEKIYYQTLPPGLQLRQILAGGAMFGDRLIDVVPDIYSSVNKRAMQTLEQAGRIGMGDYCLYLHNRLTLLVPTGNPAGIRSVADLGRAAVRISQPDPENEDIGWHIIDMYRQAGGEQLVQRIMVEKRTAGTTLFTKVHHRETPARIRENIVDVGPVWATEARYAEACGLGCEEVAPGPELDQRQRINYYVCRLAAAPHPENGARFQDFLCSTTARAIYRGHGFITPED